MKFKDVIKGLKTSITRLENEREAIIIASKDAIAMLEDERDTIIRGNEQIKQLQEENRKLRSHIDILSERLKRYQMEDGCISISDETVSSEDEWLGPGQQKILIKRKRNSL